MHAKFRHGTQNFELRGSCTRRTCVPRKKTHAPLSQPPSFGVDKETGKQREHELVTRFWAKMIKHNASIGYFDNTESSAWNSSILLYIRGRFGRFFSYRKNLPTSRSTSTKLRQAWFFITNPWNYSRSRSRPVDLSLRFNRIQTLLWLLKRTKFALKQASKALHNNSMH